MEVDGSESPSTSGTSTPALVEAGANKSASRFEALLQHTELLSHFGKKKDSPQKAKAGRKKKPAQGTEGDSRHRKTEQEEDEELLSDLNHSKSAQSITFDESPAYIKVCFSDKCEKENLLLFIHPGWYNEGLSNSWSELDDRAV